jgi:hypothetical protein
VAPTFCEYSFVLGTFSWQNTRETIFQNVIAGEVRKVSATFSLKFLQVGAIGALLSAGCTQSKSGLKQETDDRLVPETKNLVNVAPVMERMVNDALREARAKVGITSDNATKDQKEALVKDVGERIGAYVKGSGVTLLDIVQLTNLEIALDNLLQEKKHEKARIPFRCSRFRHTSLGIPFLKGAAPAFLNEKMASHSISFVFNFDGVIVGGDKLAHLFAVGRKMFQASLSQEDLWKLSQFLEGHSEFPKSEILKYAAMGSRIDPAWAVFGVYGVASTGVISTADIYANMHGYRFYENLSKAPYSYEFKLSSLCDSEKPCVWYWNEQNVPNVYTSRIKVTDAEGCLGEGKNAR